MDKHSSSKSNPRGAPTFETAQAPKEQHPRNLMGVNPLDQQFEPTESMPVRNHFKMGGGA